MRLRHLLSGLSRSTLVGLGATAGIAILAAHLVIAPGAQAATDDLVVTGPGEGGSAHIRTFLATGAASDVEYTSAGSNSSGASVATGDVTGDGNAEIITGTGSGVESQVQVWSKDGKTLVAQVVPFPGFNGGVNVAAANVDDNAALEVIVGAGPGGAPHVKVYKYVSNQLIEQYGFYAYDATFNGGVYVAGAPGKIITGAGAGGGPHVRVYNATASGASMTAQWFAYTSSFSGGVRVAAGQVRSDAVDVVTGAGPGGGPHVKLFAIDGTEGPGTFVYDSTFKGGVYVAVGGGKRFITGAGAGGGPHVKVWTFASEAFTNTASFFAYAPNFSGGVRVGGFPTAAGGTGSTTTTTTAAGGSTTSTTHVNTTTTAGSGSCVGIPPLCIPSGLPIPGL